MASKIFGFSTKVWLFTVATAPGMFLLIQFCRKNLYQPDTWKQVPAGLLLWFIMSIVELILSLLTWLVFTGFIAIIMSLWIKYELQRWLIFIIGIILTVVSFLPFIHLYGLFDTISGNADITTIMLCNSVCIGWGC